MKYLILSFAIAGCATAAASPTPTDVSQYTYDSMLCVADASSRAEADACRAAVRTKFCARFPGTCQ